MGRMRGRGCPEVRQPSDCEKIVILESRDVYHRLSESVDLQFKTRGLKKAICSQSECSRDVGTSHALVAELMFRAWQEAASGKRRLLSSLQSLHLGP